MMKLKYKEEMVDTLLFEECVDMVNNGDSWTEINNGLTSLSVVALAVNLNGDIFTGTEEYNYTNDTDSGRVLRSTDNGSVWSQVIVNSTSGIQAIGFNFFTPFHISELLLRRYIRYKRFIVK